MVDTIATTLYKNMHLNQAKQVNDVADEEGGGGGGDRHEHDTDNVNIHSHAHGAAPPSQKSSGSLSEILRQRIISQVRSSEINLTLRSLIPKPRQ